MSSNDHGAASLFSWNRPKALGNRRLSDCAASRKLPLQSGCINKHIKNKTLHYQKNKQKQNRTVFIWYNKTTIKVNIIYCTMEVSDDRYGTKGGAGAGSSLWAARGAHTAGPRSASDTRPGSPLWPPAFSFTSVRQLYICTFNISESILRK